MLGYLCYVMCQFVHNCGNGVVFISFLFLFLTENLNQNQTFVIALM